MRLLRWYGSIMPLVCVALLDASFTRARPPSSPSGDVELVAGSVMLVAGRDHRTVVKLGPATLLVGVSSIVEVDKGDRVTIDVERWVAGSAMAARVQVAPKPWLHGRPLLVPHDVDTGARYREAMRVDARAISEYQAGHLPGSRHLSQLDPGALCQEPLPVVLIGDDGYGAEVFPLFQRLARGGCHDIHVLKGGVDAWSRSALPLEVELQGLEVLRVGDVIVVDVRTPAEFDAGHLPGSQHAAIPDMTWQAFSSPVGMPRIVFYGADAADARPLEAARKVLNWRYQKLSWVDQPVGILHGGISAWAAAGKPIAKGPPPARRELITSTWPDEAAHAEVAAMIAAVPPKALLVDVRSVDAPRPVGALHLPLEDLAEKLASLPRDREIIVFCAQGIRSRIALQLLRANGFKARFAREFPAG